MSKTNIPPHDPLIPDIWRKKAEAPTGPAIQALAEMAAKAPATSHPMTGLRRVILDAIKGAPVPSMETCDRLTKAGQMEYLGDQHRWVWGWKAEFLEATSTDDLMALYDTLRPGVLESMAVGE